MGVSAKLRRAVIVVPASCKPADQPFPDCPLAPSYLREAVGVPIKDETADPSDSAIRYTRATILARHGQKQAAIEAATRALQIRPDFPEAIQLIGSLSR